ncbi:MAG: UDP-N-acetylmuramoyl-L-alanine--D-glutamate ligase, partial [Clostridia bacterium]|nr:UDP-N-acetylmuramoyl-L-alanine--D-glutamate ligase [Clostridia bacterium]
MLEYYKQYKTVGFVGCGVSNMPIIKLFAGADGFDVVVRNKTGDFKEREELEDIGVKLICGEDHLNDIYEDLLFLSPVVHQDHPEIEKAKCRGTVVTTEMQEFMSRCKGTVIGITGSDGKTTTSTIISLLLKEAGYNVYLGGNIGENLFMKLDEIKENDFAVVELSSFQLMKTKAVPDIAVITNVSPNHLDWHKDMAEYIYAKSKIYDRNKTKLLVLNKDNDLSLCFGSEDMNIVRTSHLKMLEKGASYNDEGIFYNGELYVKDEDILLPGVHNRANYSAAYCAVANYVSKEHLQKVCREFKGVEHRIELVKEVGGVKYYNSSIDTSPTRSKAALVSFKQ